MDARTLTPILKTRGALTVAAESVPVHEDIKTGKGDLTTLFRNYRETLANLAAEGITTVIYNFMPVLDWIRTDMHHILPDGSECLFYDPVRFCAFEIHALRRTGAEEDYTPEQRERGTAWWNGLTAAAKEEFIQNIIDVFPGVEWGAQPRRHPGDARQIRRDR